jgi:hypothetical protein
MGGYQQFLSSQAPSRARQRPAPETISVAVLDEAGTRRIRRETVLPYVLSDSQDNAGQSAPSRPLAREDHWPQCEDPPSAIYDDGDFLTPDTGVDATDMPDVAAGEERKKNTEQVSDTDPAHGKRLSNIITETEGPGTIPPGDACVPGYTDGETRRCTYH